MFGSHYCYRAFVKRISFIFLTAASVTACEPAKQAGSFLANNAKDAIYETTYKVQDWAMTPPKGKGEPLPVASTYCYKAQTDVLCYRQPMPGWEGRLVAYQGTDALPPPPPVMQLLPKANKDKSMLPENRVAASKPVFPEKPPEEKQEVKDPNAPELPSSLNEQLPDPSQSPQL